MAATDVRALALEVLQNMKIAFSELETCRSYAESQNLAQAAMMLSALEGRFRREWRWEPDDAAWESNVLEITRGQISEAWRLRDEVDEITANTPGETFTRRVERLVDVERASRLSLVERRIYDMTTREEKKNREPSVAAYVGAWGVVVGIMSAAVVVMLQVATTIGYDRSRHWLLGVVVNLVLMFAVLVPLEIIIFDVALPSLILDQLQHLDDPTALRTFPFAANVPASPVFFFCQLEPAYESSRLGRYAVGDVARKARDLTLRESSIDGHYCDKLFLSDKLPGIHDDLTWAPTPAVRAGLRLCAALVALPDYLHKPVFEELMLLVATLGAVSVSMLLDRVNPTSQESVAELYFLLAAVISVVIVVVLVRVFVKSHDVIVRSSSMLLLRSSSFMRSSSILGRGGASDS